MLKLLGHETNSIRPFLVSGRGGLGSFDKRVFFVNVELGADFKAAQQRLAHGLSHAGVPPERRPYRPHITLATRLWPEQFDRFWSEAAEFKPDYAFRCRCISLFGSARKTAGRIGLNCDCNEVHGLPTLAFRMRFWYYFTKPRKGVFA